VDACLLALLCTVAYRNTFHVPFILTICQLSSRIQQSPSLAAIRGDRQRFPRPIGTPVDQPVLALNYALGGYDVTVIMLLT